MKTPDYNHIFRNPDYSKNVYEPSEDTFILLDAIENDIKDLKNRFRVNQSPLCLEIGTGNGVPGTFLLEILLNNNLNPFIYLTDINSTALKCAQETILVNSTEKQDLKARAGLLRSNLFEAFSSQLSFDIGLESVNFRFCQCNGLNIGTSPILFAADLPTLLI